MHLLHVSFELSKQLSMAIFEGSRRRICEWDMAGLPLISTWKGRQVEWVGSMRAL